MSYLLRQDNSSLVLIFFFSSCPVSNVKKNHWIGHKVRPFCPAHVLADDNEVYSICGNQNCVLSTDCKQITHTISGLTICAVKWMNRWIGVQQCMPMIEIPKHVGSMAINQFVECLSFDQTGCLSAWASGTCYPCDVCLGVGRNIKIHWRLMYTQTRTHTHIQWTIWKVFHPI